MNYRPSITILGVPFDNVTSSEALDRIEQMVTSRKPHYLATANVDFLVQAREDIELRRILFDADLILCDGTPLLWVSRLLGNPLPERVAGADVVPRLIQLAAEKKYRLFLLGATPDSVSRAAANLREAYPDLIIAGHYSPPFNKLIEMDHEQIKARILAAKPDVLLVSFGCPKQEKWIAMHYRTLGVPVAAGVGATIDFLAGKVSRAPVWMRRSGLEWVYRMIQEPRRLFRRYFKDLWIFSWSILAQWWALQFQNGRTHSTGNTQSSSSHCAPDALHQVVVCPAELDAMVARADALQTADIIADGRDCFLQMAGVTSIDSTGVGYLIGLQKKLRIVGRELVLIAPGAPVRRALGLMRINEFFLTAADLPSAQYLLQVRARERATAVTLRTAAAVTPLAWQGEITAANAGQVWENTRAYLEAPRQERELTLDLSDVRFIDSSGLGLMIRAKRLAQKRGAKLVFKGIQPAVRNVMKIARLEEYLEYEAAPDSKSLPKRSPIWREVFSLPEVVVPSPLRPAHPAEAMERPAPIFGASDAEPVTNAALATSHE
jgi:N-acetylglucosaminyldiphosphoundecaprenol N-acetyl-beta-D-mannosaminyltransferase